MTDSSLLGTTVFMKIFFIALSLLTQLAMASDRDVAQDILLRFHNHASVNERLEIISKIFIGLPYGKGGPLGEGSEGKFDQDPLYRFDTFDCTTYVETIMALALSREVSEFEIQLDKIRYEDGVVDYLKRNHFTDLQWIPSNVKNGLMSEINHDVTSPENIKIAEALINFPKWISSHQVDQIIVPGASSEDRKQLLDELRAEASFYKPQIARVPYIAIASILRNPQILNNIPHASVVNFVRPNWDLTQQTGTHQNISHQGFLFRLNKVLYLRHASTSGRVEEVPFIDYLKRFQNHPTLKGIHLMKLN